MALTVALVYLVVSFADFDLSQSDFRCFYESAWHWWHGDGPFYSMTYRPNLTPPWFAVLLTPLLPLGLAGAFAVWTAISVLAVALSVRLILKERPALPWWLLVAVVVSFLPAWTAWRQGQVTWILFALVTRAWLAKSTIASGLWLAPVVMLKPYFAVMALVLPWPIALVTGAASLVGTLLGIAALGWPLWAEWLAIGSQVSWFGNFANVSLWGHAARLATGRVDWHGFDVFTPGWILAIVFVTGLFIARTIRASGDGRWAMAFLVGLFVSPLGWLYTMPAGFGPIVAALRSSRWLVVTAVTFLIPNIVYCVWWKMGGTVALMTAMITPLAALCLFASLKSHE